MRSCDCQWPNEEMHNKMFALASFADRATTPGWEISQKQKLQRSLAQGQQSICTVKAPQGYPLHVQKIPVCTSIACICR